MPNCLLANFLLVVALGTHACCHYAFCLSSPSLISRNYWSGFSLQMLGPCTTQGNAHCHGSLLLGWALLGSWYGGLWGPECSRLHRVHCDYNLLIFRSRVKGHGNGWVGIERCLPLKAFIQNSFIHAFIHSPQSTSCQWSTLCNLLCARPWADSDRRKIRVIQ